MADKPPIETIDQYIAQFPETTRTLLERIRAIVAEIAPEATERISYAIPTFDLDGTHLVHFAGFARHVGLYPTPVGMETFAEALKPYKTGKGSVQFPLDQPLPEELIRRIVEYRVATVRGPSGD